MKKIKLLLTTITTCLVFVTSASNYWSISSEKTAKVPGNRKIVPNEYVLAQLNTADFQLFQSYIPMEGTGNYSSIFLPTPSGEYQEFKIFECPMMEKPLADKYAQIKTYTAMSVANPSVSAKIDFTLFGFHAMVFDGENTYLIDPYTDFNTGWYVVYFKKDYSKPYNQRMACGVEDHNDLNGANAISLTQNDLPTISYKQNGTNKRAYRLALACTVEYSAAVGGATPTKASVLSAMVTSMNRVNGVFEKDFSMHANLVANNDTLIYIGTTDPYTNNSGSTMLGQNQTTITSRIGSANYDYGHVFSTGGGGIASLGCVCSSGSKAQGVTGSPSPVGDAYDIDYVAHEMGHQFGGNHTFNSVNGSCSGNRNSSTAYEIGSATTIMGYAGICSPDDIQQHSDDYYHIKSLEEMTGTSVMACATNTVSNNGLPTLAAITKTYIIPYKTPFELTAVGTDPDNNPMTYCWEEYDRGGSGGAWNAATTVAPILRSFSPTTSPTRVFPTFLKLLQNVEAYMGERLPDTNRIVKFRCTVRDMNNGYGAFYTSTDTLKLDVRKTTTLFRVTSQTTTGQTLGGSTAQTVTWDVAGTSAAPFNTANVNIYLSIDSGKTWAYTLALNTPNDGSEVITIPSNVTATWCRFKVKASDNVYFDLNDKWFAIKSAPAALSDNSLINEFSIFPNPIVDELTINSNSAIINKVRIIDMSGRVCLETTNSNKELKINTSAFSKGVYSVEIISNKGTIVSKIIK